MKRVILCVACIAMSLTSITALALEPISLAGQWHFALDRDDAGVQKEWFKQALPDQIKLPGSLQEQGFGDPPSVKTDWMSSIGAKLLSEPKYAPYTKEGSFKTPFWLTPERHYVGPAWYQREIEIPADWSGKRVVLFLQRPHWETTVWVDDRLIGSQNSLGTPHDVRRQQFDDAGITSSDDSRGQPDEDSRRKRRATASRIKPNPTGTASSVN